MKSKEFLDWISSVEELLEINEVLDEEKRSNMWQLYSEASAASTLVGVSEIIALYQTRKVKNQPAGDKDAHEM